MDEFDVEQADNKEYERIIRKHYKGKEMADNTNFKEWGEKIKNVATNDDVKKAMSTMSKTNKIKRKKEVLNYGKQNHKKRSY